MDGPVKSPASMSSSFSSALRSLLERGTVAVSARCAQSLPSRGGEDAPGFGQRRRGGDLASAAVAPAGAPGGVADQPLQHLDRADPRRHLQGSSVRKGQLETHLLGKRCVLGIKAHHAARAALVTPAAAALDRPAQHLEAAVLGEDLEHGVVVEPRGHRALEGPLLRRQPAEAAAWSGGR
jgi:hypothetical protein